MTALTVAYNGAAFHGFARQPALETVQGRLEASLTTALHREVQIVGAGRTDAGVHAMGQVVSFAAHDDDPGPHDLLRSMNALNGRDIVCSEVRHARQGFSARYDAVSREYRYLLVPGAIPPLAIGARAWWAKGSLDLTAMREAAQHLVGDHDFRSFCVAGSAEGKRTVRNIQLLEIRPESQMGEHCIAVRIVGRSFLHSMVRIIVGTLVEVGKGRRDPAFVADALISGRRDAAGRTAPPHGLTLWHVGYPDEYWL
jgi:tRNA pseudouridine38-40 synthase